MPEQGDIDMANIRYKTKNNANPMGKPKVFFSCHPKDFNQYFEQICSDILWTHDCAIYYTEDRNEHIPEQDLDTVLGSNNLLVVPVTSRLLTQPNRAMDQDVPYALRANMPILPIMMERDLNKQYSQPDKFGSLQYLDRSSFDRTVIPFEEKLRKFLESVLISDEMTQRIRAAFDAYIFLSYRKKDRNYANELMRLIHRNPQCRDIAIWYDEFLTPGESFQESIDKILHSSKLFALLVTPNLLEEPDGKPNYVMAAEYPAAKASGIDIFPAEMEFTDKASLTEKYQGIPNCVPTCDENAFQDALLAAVQKAAITTNNTDPEHMFLVGLAYWDGIDVEVDRARGIELITAAAENRLPEAMKALGTKKMRQADAPDKALYWAGQYLEYYKQECGENHPDTLAAMFFAAQVLDEYNFSDAAVCLCQKAYTSQCKILGEDHCDTLASLLFLADKFVYLFPEKAVELYEKAYEGIQNTLGGGDPKTFSVLYRLADAHYALHNAQRVFELYENANSQLVAHWGSESHEAYSFMRTRAETYVKLGNYQEALDLYSQLFALRYNSKNTDNTIAMDTLNRMVEICDKLGNRQTVLPLLKKAFAHQCKALGKENPKILRSLDILADTYDALDKHHTAKKLHKKAYALRCKVFGEDSANVPFYLDCLMNSYRRRGDQKNADRLEKKINALEKKRSEQQEAEREQRRARQKAERADNTANNAKLEFTAAPAAPERPVPAPPQKSYWQEQQERCQQSYAILPLVLGEEDELSLKLLRELAWCYVQIGDSQKAAELYRKAYPLHDKMGYHQIALDLKKRADILAWCSDRIPDELKKHNIVYLIPCGDREYRAAICEEPPENAAIALEDEGTYPVEVSWSRLDLNTETVWEDATCEDDKDLVALLDSLGRMGADIEYLDFHRADDTVKDMTPPGAVWVPDATLVCFNTDSDRLAFMDYLREGGFQLAELDLPIADELPTVLLAIFDADHCLNELVNDLFQCGRVVLMGNMSYSPAGGNTISVTYVEYYYGDMVNPWFSEFNSEQYALMGDRIVMFEDAKYIRVDGYMEEIQRANRGDMNIRLPLSELFARGYVRQTEQKMAEMVEINDEYVDDMLYGDIYDT